MRFEQLKLDNIDITQEPPEQEPERQYYFIAKLRKIVREEFDRTGLQKTFVIRTFGCQMNFKDSEKLSGILEAIGYVQTDDEKADVVLYNTCTVRENANTRVYGRIGYLGKLKKANPDMIIALCGCMMQEPQVVETIQKSYRFVDIIFGTHNIFELAELLYRKLLIREEGRYEEKTGTRMNMTGRPEAGTEAAEGRDVRPKAGTEAAEGRDARSEAEDRSEDITEPRGKQTASDGRSKAGKSRRHKDRMVVELWDGTKQIVEELPSERKYGFKAGVNIMFGCNNFCSYCIVPYVRGRERSRKVDDILCEIKEMEADGIKEIMLLGQNVNSYGKDLETPVTFAELLSKAAKVEGIERIRFMTSHPKDLSAELIRVMSENPHICKHLHLPVQSGSSRILKIMNRKYTKEAYLQLVADLRAAIPEISLTTDIIVGFPGETEEDFEETLDLVRKVGFDGAYTFLYSKRTGTPAATMDGQVPEEVAKERFNRLLQLIQEQSAANADRLVGRLERVLVEEADEQEEGMLTGRLENNMLVHFNGDRTLIGSFCDVRLMESKGFYFIGALNTAQKEKRTLNIY